MKSRGTCMALMTPRPGSSCSHTVSGRARSTAALRCHEHILARVPPGRSRSYAVRQSYALHALRWSFLLGTLGSSGPFWGRYFVSTKYSCICPHCMPSTQPRQELRILGCETVPYPYRTVSVLYAVFVLCNTAACPPAPAGAERPIPRTNEAGVGLGTACSTVAIRDGIEAPAGLS